MLIYVAGPYSAETEAERVANVHLACLAGQQIIERGHWPFVPHLTHFFDAWVIKHRGLAHEPELYMKWDFAILERCDALLFLRPSPGANRELALAWERGKLVYLAIDEIPVPAGTAGGCGVD